MRLAVKRLVAYWLDFVMLAGVLTGGQALLYLATGGFPFDRFQAGYEIELWVLATMSLPVWCYFIGMEYKKGQTIGKRLLKLKAVERGGSRLTLRQAFVRTFVRLLPWELAHLIVLVPEPWWDADPAYPALVYIPNALMLLYIAVLAVSGGKRTLHDAAAGTRVQDAGSGQMRIESQWRQQPSMGGRILLILSISFITFVSFFLIVFFLVLSKGEKVTEIEIQKNEVNNYLNYPGSIAWPNWDTEKITCYDDHFTSPMVIVHFQNGIVLELSKGKFNISHLQERTISINGDAFTYYSDKKQKYYLWVKGFLYYLIIAPEKMDDNLYYGYIKEITNN